MVRNIGSVGGRGVLDANTFEHGGICIGKDVVDLPRILLTTEIVIGAAQTLRRVLDGASGALRD